MCQDPAGLAKILELIEQLSTGNDSYPQIFGSYPQVRAIFEGCMGGFFSGYPQAPGKFCGFLGGYPQFGRILSTVCQ